MTIDGLGGMLRHMLKANVEYVRGKIRISTLGYIWSDKGYTNPQNVHLKARDNGAGRLVSLQHRLHVSNCPKPPEGVDAVWFAKNPEVFWVPSSKCKKCEHRRKGGYCNILREKRTSVNPAQEVAKVVAQATKDATAILNNGL